MARWGEVGVRVKIEEVGEMGVLDTRVYLMKSLGEAVGELKESWRELRAQPKGMLAAAMRRGRLYRPFGGGGGCLLLSSRRPSSFVRGLKSDSEGGMAWFRETEDWESEARVRTPIRAVRIALEAVRSKREALKVITCI